VYIFLRIQTVGGFRSIFEKYNELFHCNDVFFHAGCKTDKPHERVHKIWAKVECGEYHVTAVSLRHYERNRVNTCFLFL
jgi:hypothetical protein